MIQTFSHKQYYALLLTIILVICAPYLSTLSFPFHFDDRTNIVENRALRLKSMDLAEIERFFKDQPPSAINRPVANISFAVQLATTGLDTFWFHLLNLLIHATNVFLLSELFLVCLQRLNPSGGVSRQISALAGAAIWGASPLHTESVTYIVQRETSLSAMFFLGACVLFVKVLNQDKRNSHSQIKDWRIPAVFLLFLLSVATKENGLLMPYAMAILSWIVPWPEKNFSPGKLASCLVLGATLIILALGLLFLGPETLSWKLPGPEGYGPVERMMTQPRVLLWYTSLLLFPLPQRLTIDIAFPASRGLFSPPTTALALALLLAASILALRWRKTRPLFSMAIFWYLALSAMESSFLNLEMAFLHRTYLPSAFVFLLIADSILGTGKTHREQFLKDVVPRRKLIALGVVFLLFLFLTAVRNQAYSSGVALWSDAVSKSPQKPRPRFNLGRALQEKAQLDRASENYLKAIELDPGYFRPYANLAVVLEEQGDLKRAQDFMNRAFILRPDDGEVLYNMGRYSFMGGEMEKAIYFLSESLKSRELTLRGDAYWYLALIAEEKRDLESARIYWARAIAEYEPETERGVQARTRMERLQ